MPNFTSSFELFRGLLPRFARNRLALVGACIVTLMLLVTVAAPYLVSHDPNQMAVSERLAPLSSNHFFGTDQFGRDIYSRVIFGTRISISVGLIAVSLGLSLGVPLGALSGYFGRILDNTIMRLMDSIMAFPGMMLVALIPDYRKPPVQGDPTQ